MQSDDLVGVVARARSITIGTAGTEPLELSLDALIGSHLGIVANSGGGKSGLIRKLLEATHGRVQHIVLDSEDEFYTLRERYDYVIAGGEGGDTPATVDNAAQLAIAALTHGFSLICQINDLGRAGANEFIDRFLTAMIAAPKSLWHPCLVVIDEVQRFDETAIGKLTGEGRKRGFTAVLATQRLPKMDANVRGDLNNWIMGRVGQSLDRRNMADQLGMAPSEARALAQIEERRFYAFGPALSREPVLFRVGDVETTMVRPGQARVQTTPPPEALREILSGLAVKPDPEAESGNAARNMREDMSEDWVERYCRLAESEGSLRARLAEAEAENEELEAERDRFKAAATDYRDRIGKALHALGIRSMDELDEEDWSAGLKPAKAHEITRRLDDLGSVQDGRKMSTDGHSNPGGDHEVAREPEKAEGRPSSDSGRPSTTGNGSFPPRHQRILDGIAWAQRLLKRDAVERNIVAWLAEISPKSSSYANDLSALRTKGLLDYPGQGTIALTDAGSAKANWPKQPPSRDALFELIKRRLEPRHRRILDVLWSQGEQYRADLANRAEMSPTSSSYANDLSKLRTLGLVDYLPNRMVGLGSVLQ